MDWLDRMNNAMEYVETHLSEEIHYDQVARIACCSTYHFQRMFPFITGVPLSEYIRRRRLTLAAFELQQSGTKVIDTALKYGYESPEAFSRAFKKMHGVMPMSARDKGVSLKAYPRLSFHISIRGDVEMNYRIEEKQAFEMFGVATVINDAGDPFEQPFVEIPAFWTKCVADGTVDRIRAAAGLGENGQLHSVLYNNHGGKFSYMIGYFLPQSGLPGEFEKLHIPPQTYAIFATGLYPDGQSGIHELWRRIWGEWFPSSNYEFANGPEFEMTYDRGNDMYEMEVWIPVVNKSAS
ncbi:AraC family transcriptional regulator [Paenibacillus lutrae]|uniref:Helix-turn-helix domain-containing protein n=1 Tax=Paenibacillus lutrae TaxID=2078573 RepID=A0A7X3K083_9BACL|nr:effector binding domain-containing protein [Paenibacillus lutrae]MVP00711.1 helix-turn-helix domain-containing protein [Paenibacillus lutrae]